jgi:hypothetical protein
MATSPVTPPNQDEVSQIVSGARDWSGWLYTTLGGLFGGGVVYGTMRSTIDDHERRLAALERIIEESIKRLEDKMDQHYKMVFERLTYNRRN